MRDKPTIESAIKDWIVDATGLPATSVFWNARPREWRGNYIILQFTSFISTGRDSSKVQDASVPTPGEEIEIYQLGNRDFTLRVNINSYHNTPTGDAVSIAELVVSTTKKKEYRDLFSNASIGFRQVLGREDLTEITDDRERTVHELQMGFHADSAALLEKTTYVEQWGIESNKLKNPDGTDASIQIDDLMP